MTDKEAMKLALFALDIVKIHYTQNRHVNEAIAALKERLAQEKALQALHNENERLGLYRDAYTEPESECNPQDLCAGCRCKYAHVQPEQEPVAWVCFGAPGKRDIDFEEADINKLPIGTLLYTIPPAQPPQRTEEKNND